MRFLIAEDDEALGNLLRRGLQEEADCIALVGDGESAIESFLQEEPDLLLLDLDLPVRSGMEVLAIARAASPLCPILVLSGQCEPSTRIACLDMGADDCMLKPFSLRELRAKCRSMLRRQQAMQERGWQENADIKTGRSAVLALGELRMQRLHRTVEVSGSTLHLTLREFKLLEQLLLGQGGPVLRTHLSEALWGARGMDTNALDVHAGALRRKLSLHPHAPRIETIRGRGYCLCLPADRQSKKSAVQGDAYKGAPDA